MAAASPFTLTEVVITLEILMLTIFLENVRVIIVRALAQIAQYAETRFISFHITVEASG
jgi:hypothetical protein